MGGSGNRRSQIREYHRCVASDFLLVASTLLEIKAESLLPRERDAVAEEFEELAPSEARDILVERLLAYKQYKNAASALHMRFVSEGRMHPRPFGPDACFLNLMPDYLKDVTMDGLALLADTQVDYPLDGEIYQMIARVKGKPFKEDFLEQMEAAEALYGAQLRFTFTKDDVETALSKVRPYYGDSICQRIQTVIFEQMRKYQICI